MTRVILLTFLLFAGLASAAQHPFNYGKTKQVYFFSKADIVKLGIKELSLPSIPPDGKDNVDADLQVISYADTSNITNGWYPYYGVSKKKLSIKQLRDSSYFMNGHFYTIDENGRVVASGGEGRGALCQDAYEYDSAFTVVITSCRYDVTEMAGKIFYHPNGLPHFTVCCKTDSSNVDIIIDDTAHLQDPDTVSNAAGENVVSEDDPVAFYKMDDRPWDYTDTTWYVYDSKWRITGTRSSSGSAAIFNTSSNPGGDWLINGTRFENFIDRKIGFRPKLVLFEIYKNAVFSFTYSEKSKSYGYSGSVELE